MKRNMKRLTLNRETLRHLNEGEMSAAQGAASEVICQQTDVNCPVVIRTQTCFANCVSQTCPTQCGQWYCHGV